MTTADEKKLVKRAIKGDEQAWSTIHARLRPQLLTLSTRMVGQEMAEDMVQDCFLLLWRKLHTFKGRSRLKTFVWRIQINCCLMALRKRSNRPLASLDEMLETNRAGELLDRPVRSQITTHDGQLESVVERATIERLVDELPPLQKLHIQLHEIDGWQAKEIAFAFGTNINNAKSTIFRAREALQKKLLAR